MPIQSKARSSGIRNASHCVESTLIVGWVLLLFLFSPHRSETAGVTFFSRFHCQGDIAVAESRQIINGFNVCSPSDVITNVSLSINKLRKNTRNILI